MTPASSPGTAPTWPSRTVAFLGSVALATTLLLVLPVTSTAAPPSPVTPEVQTIELGSLDAPEEAKVVEPEELPIPSAGAEPSEQPADEPAETPPSTATPSPTAPPSDSGNADPAPSQAPGSPNPPVTENPSSGATSEVPPPSTPEPSSEAPSPAPTSGSSSAPPSPPADAKILTLEPTETDPFAAVGVSWLGSVQSDEITVFLRSRATEDGQWSDWNLLSINFDVPDAERNGTDPYWIGQSDAVEVAVALTPDAGADDVQLTLIDPKEVAADAAPSAAPTSSASADAAMPAVYSRAAWGADESQRSWAPSYTPTIKAATIHHTADSNNYGEADVPRIMRSIYYYQAVTLGWGDIGYNVVVDKFGRAWEGRYGGLDQPVVAAHAGGFNQSTFGVSMLGNYDQVQVPAATSEKIAQLIAWKFNMYGVNPKGTTQLTQQGGAGTTAKFADGQTVTLNTIFGHRDTGYTACPGQYGYAALPGIRDRAAAIMSTLPPPTPYNPEAALNAVSAGDGTIAVDGWAFDRSALLASVNVMLTINGQVASIITANGPRPELANYGIPGNHGFSTKLTPPALGSNSVCLFAFNVGGGSDVLAACRTVNVQVNGNHDPVGAINARASGATVYVDGWAYDPSAPAGSITVMVQADGENKLFIGATGPRPELAYYGIPGNHGFSGSFTATKSGTVNVCLFAFNVGPGTSKTVDCRSVTVTLPNQDPVGALAVSASNGQIYVNGWAYDPSAPASPINVMITTNGAVTALTLANGPRPELANYGIPGSHGFAFNYKAPKSGTNNVCLFGFNLGPGTDKLLYCINVTV